MRSRSTPAAEGYAGQVSALAPFTPVVRTWFERTFDAPTPAQEQGWPAIASGRHVLIQAPTGSGKTLAAFLWALDRARPGEGTQVLYVSPLKALNYDVERNLRGPLAGIGSELSVAVRTGDTPPKERAAMLRSPPDILITTPESLFLMLTSRAQETLGGVQVVIVDEVHAVAGSKRGAHLALSLERLERLVGEPIQRVGLSATQRPLEEIGRFVSGGRPIELVDAGTRKELDLKVVVPLDDMREPGEGGSIWPSIHPALLELVQEHRSTIVFVNNRRLAERLALRLNELAEKEIARAHHGSLAREQRIEVEELLKKGEIPCLVATSSLELGIDMGAVDLVIQVESPKSVARGLQRVGRAGHRLDEASKGRIFPKFRADLLESAVVAQRMKEGLIEETRIPRNPLDVLAQQIVAICAQEEIAVDELHDLVRRAWPFRDISRQQLENVLDMLAGRYPSEEFAELRPRITWDRTAGVVRGREGARRLAVTNAGTIPDRGLFGVYLVEGGGRVGELDEEMVYEARAGQTFLLGASTWRIEEITRDRVLVSPAPGVPGLVPFWKGEGVGRPYELGEAIGRAGRELVALSDAKARERLTGEHELDERAAGNLLTFLREQEQATGALPSDRTIVVERFRDEIGDWRLCLLTPFGARVHAPWALALAARLRESLGLEVNFIWSDDGIALHLPDADAPPPLEELLVGPDELEDLVVAELGGAALFGARFRENAARALLIPRRRPGQRTPLWQQRLKAQGLLQVARRYPDFPVVLETFRECLQDVFDLPALRGLLEALRQRRIDLVEVETPSASPFASSLLFDYVATYMYEDDTPLAERRAQALALDRDLLKELLGQEELRDLIDRDAVDEVEEQLRGRAGSPDQLHDLLLRRGDLVAGEFDEELAATLESERRAVRVRLAGGEHLIAAEDAGRYRDALGAMPPAGLPDAYLEGGEDPLGWILRRFARGRGPFTTDEVVTRFALDPVRAEEILAGLDLVRGELRPGGTEREWCDPDVLRRLRRASLARLRKEVEPVDAGALGRFLPGWQGVDRRATLREALVPLQGLSLPVALWEGDLLPRRVPGYQPAWLDQLTASGEVVWVGAGLERVALYFREDAAALGRPGALPPPEGEAHEAIREALGRRSALLVRPARCNRRRGRGGAAGALGSRVGRRGDERRLAAAARQPPVPGCPPGEAAAPLLARPRQRDHCDAGPLVVGGRALPRRPRPARARRAAARAARHRHARRRPSRGNSRRVRAGLLRVAEARDARSLPPRVLRRGPRRSAVRASRRRRAPARAAGGGDDARPRGRRSRPALRSGAVLAQALGRARGAGRRRPRRPARRGGGALRRARRTLAGAAAGSGGSLAANRARRSRRARTGDGPQAARRGALRRQPRRRDRGHAAPPRGRLPRRPAPRRPPRVTAGDA